MEMLAALGKALQELLWHFGVSIRWVMVSSQSSKTQEVNLIGMARVLTSSKWFPSSEGS